MAEDYSARQRITVHGRGLQCTAEDYSARQRITVHGRRLQCTAEDYTVHGRGRGLQCTAEDYSAEDYSARQRITVPGTERITVHGRGLHVQFEPPEKYCREILLGNIEGHFHTCLKSSNQHKQ